MQILICILANSSTLDLNSLILHDDPFIQHSMMAHQIDALAKASGGIKDTTHSMAAQ